MCFPNIEILKILNVKFEFSFSAAYLVEQIALKFQNSLSKLDPESKELDNLLLLLSHMFNLKVVHACLLFDVLNVLLEKDLSNEKIVELLLMVLQCKANFKFQISNSILGEKSER